MQNWPFPIILSDFASLLLHNWVNKICNIFSHIFQQAYYSKTKASSPEKVLVGPFFFFFFFFCFFFEHPTSRFQFLSWSGLKIGQCVRWLKSTKLAITTFFVTFSSRFITPKPRLQVQKRSLFFLSFFFFLFFFFEHPTSRFQFLSWSGSKIGQCVIWLKSTKLAINIFCHIFSAGVLGTHH